MKRDSLGDRMKIYESQWNGKLLRNVPVIIRIDGKAFHQFTKGLQKPYCQRLHMGMVSTMVGIMHGMQGAKFGYTQSDEISILLTDTDTIETEAWFSNKIQKMCSVTASLATAHFNSCFEHPDADIRQNAGNLPFALFDARVFNIPEHEVANYFIWRQKDAIRNSIQMLAQHYFSHKQLQGKSCKQLQEKLMNDLEHPVDWTTMDLWAQRGSCSYRSSSDNSIKADTMIPIFTESRDFITKHMFNAHTQDKK